MPNRTITKPATPRILYALLFIYAGIAGTYEVVNSVSTTIGISISATKYKRLFKFMET